jgi:hypothetical protein
LTERLYRCPGDVALHAGVGLHWRVELQRRRQRLCAAGAAGDTITLYDGSSSIGTATVASNGTWSLKVKLASGSHTLTATQTLTAGVTSSASAAWAVTVPSH